MRHYRRFICVLLFVFLLSGQAYAFWIWTPKSKKFINPKFAVKDTPKEQFKWAMRLFDEEEYIRAADEFARLVTYYSDSVLAPEAQYYAGRAYEEAEKYYFAFENYQKALDLYPFTKMVDDIIEREYNLGLMLYERNRGTLMGKELMTELDRAVEIFRKVKENAPFGEYADKAQFMIGQCYKKSELYAEAKEEFQKLVEEYPQSKLNEKASYEVAEAAYMGSQSADYDQEFTDEAIAKFKRIAEDKSGLALSYEAEEAVLVLEERKAEGLFKTAKFYERQKKYKSAAIYYEEILRKYPRSSFSEQASENLKGVYVFLKEG